MPTPEKPWVEVYAILLKSSVGSSFNGKPRLIGTCGIPRIEPLGAEIGYGLHPDYWGAGYMLEALRLFISLYWASESMTRIISALFIHAIHLFGDLFGGTSSANLNQTREKLTRHAARGNRSREHKKRISGCKTWIQA